jgi:DNA-binding MarR family transcriptional regulator
MQRQPALGQQELGQIMGVDPSVLVTLLNPLEADGYVSRQRDPADRRRNVVALSPAGGQHLAAAAQAQRAAEDQLFSSLDPQRPANLARFTFLDQRARRFYPDWDLLADITVAILRTEAGRDPHDKDLQNLVGELSTRSDEFRTRWGAHNVRHHGSGAKTYHHPIVGELTLAYEGLELAAEPGLTLTIYTAEPGSPSEEALRLLASWAASQEADPNPQTLPAEQRHA